MRLAHALALVSFTAFARAQDPKSQDPDPVALVAKAERLVAKKEEVEDAALLLWQALELLAAKPDHPIHNATAMTARYLLDEHDPLEKERRRVFASVAKQQLELAQAYRTRKWLDTAQTRVDVAMRYDRDAAAKERGLLEAARPKPKAVAAAAAKDAEKEPEKPKPGPLLERANTDNVVGTWQVVDDRLECVDDPTDSTLNEWTTNATHENHEIVVEFKPQDAVKDHNAGIAFGIVFDSVKRSYSGYRAQYHYSAQNKLHGVMLWFQSDEMQDLGEAWIPVAKSPDGFHRLSVQVHGKSVSVQFDHQTIMSKELPAEVRGQVGLVLGIGGKPSCPVQFRNFRVDPLAADAPTDEEVREQAAAELQKSIASSLDEAKSLLDKKQPEQASLVLRDALGELEGMQEGVLRKNLAASIEQMLHQTDTIAPKRKKAAQTIAAELAGLADKYTTAGRARLALVLAKHAASFDPDGQAARLATAREAVRTWNVAQAAARASELAPPADDGAVLREWFAAGRRLDNSDEDWKVEGPSARTMLGAGALTMLMPKQGTPALTKASVHVRLPAANTAAGFCFDVAGSRDYAVALLFREKAGVSLRAYRYAGKWIMLGSKQMTMDAWRLDGWFPIAIEATAAGITVRTAGAELVLDRQRLGLATGRFGLCADNATKEAIAIELRAFQVSPP
ncbi:MAG TPA: hypothetical protein VF384_00685 [Planctomycetota bacterium]